MRFMRRSAVIITGVCIAGVIGIVTLGMQMATNTYVAQGRTRAEATLGLTLQALDGHLRRYEAVPELLADNDLLRDVLQNPLDLAAQDALNLWLRQKNTQMDAADIYVMAPNGVTIAASNAQREDSFIGQNFSYRPYFQSAIGGEKGRFFAIGTTSGVRGYYFASPVYSKAQNGITRILGVIAVKIGLDVIEAEWRLQEARIIVTDLDGIVFMSSEPAWLYKGLLPLTPDRLRRSAQSRRYANIEPIELPPTRAQKWGQTVVTLPDATGSAHEYVVAGQILPRAGWTVQVLLETRAFHDQARLMVLLLMLFLGAIAAIAAMILQRRARLAERFDVQERTKTELERRVAERTADLARVNTLIEAEIAERRLTETELRRTQSDLVQAGKLAALGQMSAALSHEINQPLAAARNYADSAAVLIERGDTVRAQENMGHILSLIDRMATIARHLRNVARKPDAPLKDIALADAVAETLTIMAPRLAGIDVQVLLPHDLPLVRGGPVRLQQVLVNLLSNAADAVADSPHRKIEITAEIASQRVLLSVRDHGAGVSTAIADRIFDPFFTTKRVGSGLGLGLSISYNIIKDFGGDLRVRNAPDGGAIFTIDLAIAQAQMQAAQ